MLIRRFASTTGLVSTDFLYDYGLVDRPFYAHGVERAVSLAGRLGYPGVTVVEFGVAAGKGLVQLERHAEYFGARSGLDVSVIGFDLGSGLPEPADYRDGPYGWHEGQFPMDEAALRRQLQIAELVIGDIGEEVPRWVQATPELATDHPVGFVSIDVDYWSSVVAVLSLFRLEGQAQLALLPRITCYVDDVNSQIEDVGAPLALREFNEQFEDRKIGRPFGHRARLPFSPSWADRIYEAHFFEHPRYTDFLGGDDADGA
jgi:hypothetical protein